MNWVKEYTLPLGLGLVLAALAVNALLAHANIDGLAESNRRLADAHERDEAADAVLLAMVNAETGHRGFVLTQKSDFLEPYNRASDLVHDRIDRFQSLAQTDADRDRIGEIERLTASKLAGMKRTLELVAAGRRDEAVAIIRDGTGKKLMDDIRAALGAVKAEEANRLRGHAAESADVLSWAKTTNLLSALLGGGLVGVAALLMRRDLAAREKSRADLQRANEELEQNVADRTTELRRSNRALEEFASVASHDLQEPLRKIQQFGDRLNKKLGPALDDANRDYLRRMLDAAGRMRGLITDLLTYSRVSTKRQPPVRLDLTEVVRGVVGDLDGRLQQSDGRVEFGELPQVEAEPTQMRQLLQNLIGNALKFQRPDVPPVVRVAGRTLDGDAGPRVELEVVDNGIGFDEKYADKIFHLFQRLHGRDEYEGTGMGLAIVRKIVEQHGGAIAARSRPGEGATFVVTLPAPPPPPPAPSASEG